MAPGTAPQTVWWRALKRTVVTVFEVLTPQSNNDPPHHTQRLYACPGVRTVFALTWRTLRKSA